MEVEKNKYLMFLSNRHRLKYVVKYSEIQRMYKNQGAFCGPTCRTAAYLPISYARATLLLGLSVVLGNNPCPAGCSSTRVCNANNNNEQSQDQTEGKYMG